MNGVIRLGDPHSHNGTVNTASGPLFDGKPVMLAGDTVSCPARYCCKNLVMIS